MSDYRTLKAPVTGRPIKAGLNMNVQRARPSKYHGIYRAVVIATYGSDDSVRTEDAPNTERLHEIECDIIMMKTTNFITRVPVMQREHGYTNASPWIPKGSDHVVGGGLMSFKRVSRRGLPLTIPPNFADLNGDKVMVQFVDGNFDDPIIVGAATHPHTKRKVNNGKGWSESGGADNGEPQIEEKYIRHAGTEFRVNGYGDVLLDTTIANPLAEAVEIPDTVTGGTARVRIKQGQRLTVQCGGVDVLEIYSDLLTGDVHIDLGEEATEKMVRGNRIVKWLLGHIHGSGMGPTSTPPPVAGGEECDPITNNASFLSRQHKLENDSDGLVDVVLL